MSALQYMSDCFASWCRLLDLGRPSRHLFQLHRTVTSMKWTVGGDIVEDERPSDILSLTQSTRKLGCHVPVPSDLD